MKTPIIILLLCFFSSCCSPRATMDFDNTNEYKKNISGSTDYSCINCEFLSDLIMQLSTSNAFKTRVFLVVDERKDFTNNEDKRFNISDSSPIYIKINPGIDRYKTIRYNLIYIYVLNINMTNILDRVKRLNVEDGEIVKIYENLSLIYTDLFLAKHGFLKDNFSKNELNYIVAISDFIKKAIENKVANDKQKGKFITDLEKIFRERVE